MQFPTPTWKYLGTFRCCKIQFAIGTGTPLPIVLRPLLCELSVTAKTFWAASAEPTTTANTIVASIQPIIFFAAAIPIPQVLDNRRSIKIYFFKNGNYIKYYIGKKSKFWFYKRPSHHPLSRDWNGSYSKYLYPAIHTGLQSKPNLLKFC